MAKRSEFAQKLLDDLRLRKERLAASSSSQSSNRTNTTVSSADAYALAKRNYRGSRELTTTETTSFRTGSSQNRSSGGSRSFTTKEAAKQIVPFGGRQSAGQIGDMSRALAFTIENGGKFTRIDPTASTAMLGFLNQLGRGSAERRNVLRRHASSTSSFPNFSHVHIEEISRGAQKLNQILRACSNGLNFDRYSIEIGKELLKGAVDLEESLQMLVNLQEASEYMVIPQRKSRITLLEEDEDEDINDGKIAEQRQLDRPTFSFDKRSRNHHNFEDVRNDLQLRLASRTNFPSEASNFMYEKLAGSHQRSASTSSQSNGEKARIPNVIAKLMGLEELPENEDPKYTTQKYSGSKQKVQDKVSKKTMQGRSNNARKRTDDTGYLETPTAKQKVSQSQTNKILAAQNDVAIRAERDLGACNASFQTIHDVKPPWSESKEMKSAISYERASNKVDKQHSDVTQSNASTGKLKDIQEKHRQQNCIERSKMKEPAFKDESQLMAVAPHAHRRTETAVVSPTENTYPNRHLSVTLNQSQNNIAMQPPHKLREVELNEDKHQSEERALQNAKQNMPVRKQKRSEPMFPALSKTRHHVIVSENKRSRRNQAAVSKKSLTEDVDAIKSERIPVGRHHRNIASQRSSTNIRVSGSRNLDEDTSPGDLESKLAKPKAAMPPPREKKPVHEPETWKTESVKLQKRELPQKINEVMIKRGGNLQNSAKSLKHHHSILQELRKRSDKLSGLNEASNVRTSKYRETEASITKSQVTGASTQPSTVAGQRLEEAEQVPNLYNPVEEDSRSLKEPQTPSLYDSHPKVIDTLLNDQRGEKLVSDDVQPKSRLSELNPMAGPHQQIIDVSKVSKSETPAPLSEIENQLKKILIKSQVFLHTAEALFKLNIPYGILDVGGLACQDEHSKLVLDCGYEIMKRKGRIQELSVHPFIKVSSTATKVRSLDELVKVLQTDIDKLRDYGRNGEDEVAIEDYMRKLLECDVYNKHPDVNCMWDLSWNEMMFAFIEKDDVIRDVESFVLSGLVDEITRDLHQVQVQASG